MKLLLVVLIFTITGCATKIKPSSISDGHIESAISDSKRIDDKAVIVEQYLSQ